MALPAEPLPHTYADIRTWDERVELIQGEAYLLASPSRIHQRISLAIAVQLGSYLEGKTCEVYAAPFDVRLFEKDGDRPEDVDTVVQPDLCVVCDPGKLDDAGCRGAPDLVIEILSPSNRRHDRVVKLDLYQRSGVREYWVVDPENQSVLVLLLDETGALRIVEDYSRSDQAKVHVLEDCQIDLSRVFPEPGT